MRAACFAALLVFTTPAAAGFQAAAEYSAAREGVAMVVLQDGARVFEDYPNAGAPDRLNLLASGTKSFSGVMAAAAVQDGLLTLDEPVAASVPAWAADTRRDVTIRQVLSLVSGIETPAPFSELRVGFDEALERPLVHEPGSTFVYGQAPFQIFGAVMTAKLASRGEAVTAYLERRILKPLGVRVEWRGRGDDPNLGGGAAMTARDWATFGEFVRLGGRWNGAQLVDPQALSANFAPTEANPAYGMTWWMLPARDATLPDIPQLTRASDLVGFRTDPRAPQQLWMAAGMGKQRLYIVPDRKLVIVRQSGRLLAGERSGFSDVDFLRLALD